MTLNFIENHRQKYFCFAHYLIAKDVKNSLMLMLQRLRWCCVDCVIHHERDVREEQHHTYMWRE